MPASGIRTFSRVSVPLEKNDEKRARHQVQNGSSWDLSCLRKQTGNGVDYLSSPPTLSSLELSLQLLPHLEITVAVPIYAALSPRKQCTPRATISFFLPSTNTLC